MVKSKPYCAPVPPYTFGKKSSKMREITLNLFDKPFGYFDMSTPSQVYMRNG